MHSACNHLLWYNMPFSESHQFVVSLWTSSANIWWKRSVAGILVNSKADFKRNSVTLIIIQFTLYVLSPDLTWVRQISSDLARSRVTFLGGFCMCLALSRMPDILSERSLHVFLLKCNCRLVEKIIHSHCLFDCSTQPSTLLLFNKKNLWFSFIFLFTTISMKIVKSHYVLFLRSELLHFPLLSFLMNNFILLCHRSRCLITTVLSSAIYPGFL